MPDAKTEVESQPPDIQTVVGPTRARRSVVAAESKARSSSAPESESEGSQPEPNGGGVHRSTSVRLPSSNDNVAPPATTATLSNAVRVPWAATPPAESATNGTSYSAETSGWLTTAVGDVATTSERPTIEYARLRRPAKSRARSTRSLRRSHARIA